MSPIAERFPLVVEVIRGQISFMSVESYLVAGLPPLFVVPPGSHPAAQGPEAGQLTPASDFRHPQNAG